MPSQKNITDLADIQSKKDQSRSVIFAHYHGLKANQINDLRDKVRQAGGELVVSKNTLLRIAFGKSDEINSTLAGPTAAIFAYEDEIAPLKAVADFAKENELPKLTAGYFNHQVISADQVNTLSKLPGKQQLQAMVVGTLAAPLHGLLNVMQGNIRGLVYTLKAIGDKKK